MGTDSMGTVWEPSGVVTLLTDFGLVDPYVGTMKGVLLSRAPSLRSVVDLTHDVPPQDLELAAFHLAHAFPWFPPGTVHVAVVDPGVGGDRAILVVEAAGHAFLVPDNGLIGPVLDIAGTAVVRRLNPDRAPIAGPSRTFHGRDRFAPAAAFLAGGGVAAELGSVTADFARLAPPRARRRADGSLEAHVLFADRFGNLITDATAADLGAEGAAVRVEVGGRQARFVTSYIAAERGELIALVSSYETLEVAVREGSAAALLGARRGSVVLVRPPNGA